MRRCKLSPSFLAMFVLVASVLVGFHSEAAAQNIKLGHEDDFLKAKSLSVQDGRVDAATGLQRAVYDQASRKVYATPAAFLDAEAEKFGFRSAKEELVLVEDDVRERSRHLTYQQTFAGLPVDGRTVRVNMDREGRVSMVLSGFAKVDAVESVFDTRPSVSSGQAGTIALDKVASGRGAMSDPVLVVARPDAPVLAWRMIVWPEDEPAEYNVLVDAKTGEVLQAWDQSVSLHGPSSTHSSDELTGDPDPENVSPKRTNGSGYVFDPDPLFMSGASYGSPYSDGGDRANDELNAARKTVTLRDISQNNNGNWVLKGPFVSIVGKNTSGTTVYNPPQEASPDDFYYDRSQDGFEAVVAYYHIDKSQRYIQQLGIMDVQQNGVDVNPHGITRDDSFYYPSRNMIMFGTGGVDDAEDPAVVVHEYGHAILDAAAPGLLGNLEGRALHEGFADYWTGSYTRSLVESGQTARDDWRWVFLWDSGEGSIWNGRYLDHFGQYPQDVCVASSGSGACSVHDDGRMWATTLMEIWDDLGREVTDRLVLLSHYYLQSPVTFADAAEAVIQADFDYYGGQHAGTLISVFAGRGLVDATIYLPVVTHEPLLDTDLLDTSVTVEATVFGPSSPIVSVELIYESTSQAEVVSSLSPQSDNVWSGEMTIPAQFDTVLYYLRITDGNGNEVYDPPGAPEVRNSFLVGLDEEPPSLDHSPPPGVTFLEWPFVVDGEATDNFGVDSVTLFFEVIGADGSLIEEGEVIVTQSNGAFSVAFPAGLGVVQSGGEVRYHFEAVDGSAQHNVARLPAEGDFSVDIEAGEVLRFYDFSEPAPDLTIEGGWEAGAPDFGTAVVPVGESVLGTNLDGAYSASSGMSSIILPKVNLANVEQTYLRFWHWVDTETTGEAELQDGGVVRYRTSPDAPWEALIPDGGYSGTLSSSGNNPLTGSPAFGGFSHAWQRVSMALPSQNDLEVRFDFATNEGNTGSADRFAGWLINALEMTTLPDQDGASPEVLSLPAEIMVLPFDQAIETVRVRATDDLGVTDAWMDYSVAGSSGPIEGRLRLTQHPEDLNLFVTEIDFLPAPEPGDKITYTLTLGDAAGHAVTSTPRIIEFRLYGSEEALTSVWATGQWHPEGTGWFLSPESGFGVSALVLDARDSAQNALAESLVMDHEAMFGTDMAGLVEMSVDGGDTWQLIEPEGGYPGIASLGTGSDVDGRPAFVGSTPRQSSVFGLDAFSGAQIQIRIKADVSEGASASNRWMIYDARFESETDESSFEIVAEFGLQPNFPNPFSQSTRLMATVAESGPATIRIYDTIGREVAVLWDGFMEQGTHGMTWNASDRPAGVYYVRFSSSGKEAIQTMIHMGR